ETLRVKHRDRQRKRRHTDPNFALHNDISKAINEMLKNNGGSKAGQSILAYLGYTIDELWAHLEAQFTLPENLTPDGKVWMTRNNRGKYNAKTWDANDPSTWKWQLDHKRPHSTFHYATMECQE